MARREPRARDKPPTDPAADFVGDPAAAAFPALGEWLRKVALGLLALLLVARAYYPSEDAATGSGLAWVLLMIGVGGIAVASTILAGVARFRWSVVDLAVYALIGLVALSVGQAADRRPAITMAWEWGGLGIAYALARNLPRTRGESATLAAILVATATAVAGYGLIQASTEFPRLRAMYRSNPAAMMAPLGIVPGTPAAISFEHRLMDSNEPFATFALANSLAGFIVGPLVLMMAVALENLRRGPRADGRGAAVALMAAAAPALILLVCLILTKSRSAAVGFAGGLGLLGWGYREALPRRWLLGSALALGTALAGLVAAGVATRHLDVQILTEAKKSLGYRWEYWVGTWGVITDAPPPFTPERSAGGAFGGQFEASTTSSSRPFWWGVGPANFAGPYLRHKLPEASEEIRDPHNLVLELWAESGIWAAVILAIGLVGGVARMITPRLSHASGIASAGDAKAWEGLGDQLWLMVAGGMGWFGVWMLGRLDPVRQDDMAVRWFILGAAWPLAMVLMMPLWARRPIPAIGPGAAVAAVAINLLAAGGIGIPSVALALWLTLALGLNLRDDRDCGRLRERPGLGWGLILACGWAVLVGTFSGAVIPGWRSDRAIAEGELAVASRPPRFDEARDDFTRAIEADRYAVSPWLALADLEYRAWRSLQPPARASAGAVGADDRQGKRSTAYTRVLLALDKATEPQYRNPDNLLVRKLQVDYARQILNQLPDDAKPFEILGLQSTIAKATRQAVRLYPTSASLRAQLAQASADLGMYADAVAEARAALDLDALTPHLDKKLGDGLRSSLQARMEEWGEKAKSSPPSTRGRR